MSLRQAAMALRAAVPRVAAQAASETGVAAGTTARSLRTSAAPRAYHYDYEHGPHAMNFQDWPGRKRKVATWIVGIAVTGVAVPLVAVAYQQSKLKA